jgi:K+-transporting ATPase KdpF subunit
VGNHERLRPAVKEVAVDYLIAGITALFLLVYLTLALLRPERF